MSKPKKSQEREFIRLLALGVAPSAAAQEVGYGTGDRYRRAIRRMAQRDMARWEGEQSREDDDQETD